MSNPALDQIVARRFWTNPKQSQGSKSKENVSNPLQKIITIMDQSQDWWWAPKLRRSMSHKTNQVGRKFSKKDNWPQKEPNQRPQRILVPLRDQKPQWLKLKIKVNQWDREARSIKKTSPKEWKSRIAAAARRTRKMAMTRAVGCVDWVRGLEGNLLETKPNLWNKFLFDLAFL